MAPGRSQQRVAAEGPRAPHALPHNDVIALYAAQLTPAKACVVSDIFSHFVRTTEPVAGESSNVSGSLDNQLGWFWVADAPPFDAAREAALRRLAEATSEPAFAADAWRVPSAQRLMRFLFSRPLPELRAFLKKEAGRERRPRAPEQDVFSLGLLPAGAQLWTGGSNTDRVFAAYARALGKRRAANVAVTRQILRAADATRKADSTYPFTSDHLIKALRQAHVPGLAALANPDPDLDAVDVEHTIAAMCALPIALLRRTLHWLSVAAAPR
jgi:hypothetical protein